MVVLVVLAPLLMASGIQVVAGMGYIPATAIVAGLWAIRGAAAATGLVPRMVRTTPTICTLSRTTSIRVTAATIGAAGVPSGVSETKRHRRHAFARRRERGSAGATAADWGAFAAEQTDSTEG